jgi:hypothetical protein
LENAHDSQADVAMTDTQAGEYFRGTEHRLKPSGITHYFTTGGATNKWVDYFLTKDDTGDLLLPPECEYIKDLDEVIEEVLDLSYFFGLERFCH